MMIGISLDGLRRMRWSEAALRFLFGGAMTAAAGLLAKRFGPVVGGLFLAFPAIFPASATLVEKHEKEEKRSRGLRGAMRGRYAAGADAAGAVMGSAGLILFAIVVWQMLPRTAPWLAIAAATLAWATASVLTWLSGSAARVNGGPGIPACVSFPAPGQAIVFQWPVSPSAM